MPNEQHHARAGRVAMLSKNFNTAVENGNDEYAKYLYEKYAKRYGEEKAKTLWTPSLIAKTFQKCVFKEGTYHPDPYYEMAEFFFAKVRPSKRAMDAALGESSLMFCAKKALPMFFEALAYEMTQAEDLNEEDYTEISKTFIYLINECYFRGTSVEKYSKLIERLAFRNGDFTILKKYWHYLQSLKPFENSHLGIPLLPETLAKVVNNIKYYYSGPDEINYRMLFEMFLRGCSDKDLTLLTRALGRPLSSCIAEKNLTQMVKSYPVLDQYFDFEELREIAKQGDVAKLKEEMQLILSTDNNISFENIFGDVLIDLIKNKQWQMVTYLFERGAKVPEQNELGIDFFSLIKNESVASVMQTKRFQFYKNVLKNDATVLELLERNIEKNDTDNETRDASANAYMKRNSFIDTGLFDAIKAQWLKLYKSEPLNKSQETKLEALSTPLFLVMAGLLKTNSINIAQAFEAFDRVDYLNIIAETGAWMLLPYIPVVYLNQDDVHNAAEAACVFGNAQTAIAILEKFPAQAGNIKIPAAVLAQVLINEDYDTAAILIEKYNAEIDFSNLSENDFSIFNKDFIAWLQNTDNQKAKELLKCPRVAQAAELKKEEKMSEKRVDVIRASAARPLPPPPQKGLPPDHKPKIGNNSPRK